MKECAQDNYRYEGSVIQDTSIRLGSRVYIRTAICGVPGVVSGFDRYGRALIDWSADMPEIGRLTAHDLDTLIVDEQFKCKQFCLEFDKLAA